MRTVTYDYIVVGAGSAGCVLANRLSADTDVSVLLVEAGGPDTNPNIADPKKLLMLWGSEVDWKYVTEPQPGMHGRQVMISRGKVLGGSSAIYAMVYVRGNRRNYDHWHQQGNDGWSYDDVLPYFKKSEHFEGGDSAYHGAGGELGVRIVPDPTAVATAFTEAAVELGYDGPAWDYNGERQEDGAGLYQVNITSEGLRCSTAVAFLHPVLGRANLTVQTGAHVKRILIENGRATGIEYAVDGRVEQARAEREVAVCAGAFDSPKLLMLSGIGAADTLRSHGIDVVADLPGVGQNLQDHLLLPVMFKSKQELPLPTFIAEAGLFVRTRDDMSAAAPDLQYHFSAGIPAFVPPDRPIAGPTFVFVPIAVQPQSRGEVRLRSGDSEEAPVIDPHYLECGADIDVLERGVGLARELAQTKAFSAFYDGEGAPGPATADLRDYIRTHSSTVWHPVGTCKMGRDRNAVVDPLLRVHGIEGLRVADASIMPSIVSGNTNAACIMIGERAADFMAGKGKAN